MLIASSITDNVLSPSTSSLIKPKSAVCSMSYATTGIRPDTESSGSLRVSIGTYLLISSLATTTPAACIPFPRILPRSIEAYLITSGYLDLNSAVLGDISYSSNVSTPLSALFTSPSGIRNARATSRITPLSLK